MDFRSEASPWAIRGFTEDILAVCSKCDTSDTSYPCQLHHRIPQPAAPRVPGKGPQIHVYRNVCPLALESKILSPDARVDLAWVDAVRDGRHRTPSPSIACIDPRLTVLWPSPPASPSEEETSVDDGWSAFDDWRQDSPCARVPGTRLSIP